MFSTRNGLYDRARKKFKIQVGWQGTGQGSATSREGLQSFSYRASGSAAKVCPFSPTCCMQCQHTHLYPQAAPMHTLRPELQ